MRVKDDFQHSGCVNGYEIIILAHFLRKRGNSPFIYTGYDFALPSQFIDWKLFLRHLLSGPEIEFQKRFTESEDKFH